MILDHQAGASSAIKKPQIIRDKLGYRFKLNYLSADTGKYNTG